MKQWTTQWIKIGLISAMMAVTSLGCTGKISDVDGGTDGNIVDADTTTDANPDADTTTDTDPDAATDTDQDPVPNITIASGGNTDYRISLPQSPSATETHAADELASFLNQITGATFQIVGDDDTDHGHLFVLGRNNLHRKALVPEVSFDELGDDGFVLKEEQSSFIIAGDTGRGTLYGVYYLLERYLGCRWYTPDLSVIPSNPDAALPSELDTVQIPRFRYREVFFKEGDDPDYAVRNRLNGRLGHRWMNADLLMGETRGYDVINGGKAVYDVVSGHDCGNNITFMNQDARDQAVTWLRNYLNSVPTDRLYYFFFSHRDNAAYCNSGDDATFIQAHGAPSAAMADFTRYVAEQLAEEFPHVMIGMSAYLWSRKPPTGMDHFPPNMAIRVAPIEMNWSEPMDSTTNSAALSDIQGWAALSDHVLIWDYTTNYMGYIQPTPNLRAYAENHRILKDIPTVEGIFHQGAYGTLGAELSTLRVWVFGQLLWNPDLNMDSLISDFAHGVCGPAADQIIAYINALHDSVEDNPSYLATKSPVTLPYLNAELMIEADELFNQAEAAAAGDAEAFRQVKMARVPVDYVILMNGAELRHEAEQSGLTWPTETRESRLERFQQNITLAPVTKNVEGGDISQLLAALQVVRTVADPPPECTGKDCVVLQDLSFRICCGATWVGDALASDNAAVHMDGSNNAWAIQIPLNTLLPPYGDWEIYAVMRVESDGGSGTAITYGVWGANENQSTTVDISQVSDEQYHTFQLPAGPFQRDEAPAIWMVPNSGTVTDFYVDRVFAIQQ